MEENSGSERTKMIVSTCSLSLQPLSLSLERCFPPRLHLHPFLFSAPFHAPATHSSSHHHLLLSVYMLSLSCISSSRSCRCHRSPRRQFPSPSCSDLPAERHGSNPFVFYSTYKFNSPSMPLLRGNTRFSGASFIDILSAFQTYLLITLRQTFSFRKRDVTPAAKQASPRRNIGLSLVQDRVHGDPPIGFPEEERRRREAKKRRRGEVYDTYNVESLRCDEKSL